MKNGWIYFCTAGNGLTFDLEERGNSIRIWKFIPTKRESCLKYKDPKEKGKRIGCFPVEEGYLEYYTELELSPDDPQREKAVSKQILKFLSWMKEKEKTVSAQIPTI